MSIFSNSNSRIYSSRNYGNKSFIAIDCTQWGDELLKSMPAQSVVTVDNSKICKTAEKTKKVEPENRMESTVSFETAEKSKMLQSGKRLESTPFLKPEVTPEMIQPENWPESMDFSNLGNNRTTLSVKPKCQVKLPEIPPGVHTVVVMGNNDVFYGEWLDVENNFLQLKLSADTGMHHCKGQTVYLNIDNIHSLV